MLTCRKESFWFTLNKENTEFKWEACSKNSVTLIGGQLAIFFFLLSPGIWEFYCYVCRCGFSFCASGLHSACTTGRGSPKGDECCICPPPPRVTWKCKHSHWPKDVKLAANVKTVGWLPQSDLLGKGFLSLQTLATSAFLSLATFSLGFIEAVTATWGLYLPVKGKHLLVKGKAPGKVNILGSIQEK